jgi:transposase-like protein
MKNPFRYFNRSPEVIRLTVMLYIRYPLSLRQVEDILFEREYIVLNNAAAEWKRPPREWTEAGTQFAVIFGERVLAQQ